ncbi:hypothetical protein A8713_14775 [Streptomyces sp. SAT1]|uniref:hypothetical protein n=1 Tax=Streptomyces sp. SAT1 TaxID=1849967 RepID=UPI0007DCEDDD|nr:hypothetical protein A8713_14775 [Streptomyces sp. SAT1]
MEPGAVLIGEDLAGLPPGGARLLALSCLALPGRAGQPRSRGRGRSCLGLLPLTALAEAKRELEQAATAFECATRSGITGDLDSTRVLRRSIQTILLTPATTREETGPAMLLDAVLIAVAFAQHWHRTHQHAQQEAAAEQALTHLRTAYAHVAIPVLDGLARRTPGPQTTHRYAHHLQQAVPEHADRILKDPAWDALATVLAAPTTAPQQPHVRRR